MESKMFHNDRWNKERNVPVIVDPNKPTHPFFNTERVPRVLAEVVETPALMEAMRGLWMGINTLNEQRYLPGGYESSYLSKNKIRCFYCYLLRKDYRLYKVHNKKGLEQLQRDSTPRNAVPPPESFVLAPKKVEPEYVWDPTKRELPEPEVGNDEPKLLYFPFFETQEVPGKHGFWFMGSTKIEHKLWVKRETGYVPECLYHPGKPINDVFTCCERPATSCGCLLRLKHDSNDDEGVVRPFYTPRYGDNWKFNNGDIHERLRIVTPTHRSGVVVSCKTGINRRGEHELIRLSAVDLYSGEVLLDHFVWPKVPMLHLDTPRSCITWTMMNDAHKKGLCLDGVEEAQKCLWDYVNRFTYIVLHQGRDDMIHLRWRFERQRVIDTYELESRREVPERNRSLKNLSRVHLSRDIQRTRFGLDSLEDAMAIRDLVFWYAKNLPAESLPRDKMFDIDHERWLWWDVSKGWSPADSLDPQAGEQELKTFCRIGINDEEDQWPKPPSTAQARHNNAYGRNAW